MNACRCVVLWILAIGWNMHKTSSDSSNIKLDGVARTYTYSIINLKSSLLLEQSRELVATHHHHLTESMCSIHVFGHMCHPLDFSASFGFSCFPVFLCTWSTDRSNLVLFLCSCCSLCLTIWQTNTFYSARVSNWKRKRRRINLIIKGETNECESHSMFRIVRTHTHTFTIHTCEHLTNLLIFFKLHWSFRYRFYSVSYSFSIYFSSHTKKNVSLFLSPFEVFVCYSIENQHIHVSAHHTFSTRP